ncbi:MAG: amino acid adenylation domain-containing protein [Acidobacteriota bacterium]
MAEAGSSALTRAQALLWTGQALHPEAPLYNQVFTFTIDGALDPTRLERAFDRLVEQCDALRTVILVRDAVDDGAPHQRILPPGGPDTPRLEHVDLTGTADPQAAAEAWADARSRQPFDLERCTLDAALLRLGEMSWQLYLGQHHVVTDAWSMALVYRHLETLYRSVAESGSAATVEAPPFARYVATEREARERPDPATAAHWRDHAALRPTALYGHEAPSTTRSTRVEVDLGPTRSERLMAFVRRPEVGALTPDLGLFQVLATILVAWQRRVGVVVGDRARTISLGAPAHHRATAEQRETLGLFTEVLPLSVEVDEGEGFDAVLAKVRAAAFDLLRHAAPGTASAAQNRGFSTVLNVIKARFGSFDGLPVTTRWRHPGHHDREHPIRLHAHDFDGRGWCLQLDLNREVFDTRRADTVGHLLRLLDALLDDWRQPIDHVSILSDAERHRQVASFSPPVDSATSPTDVLDGWATVRRRAPDTVALRHADRSWTADELAGRVAALAATLRRVGPSPRIGLALPRSPEAVVGLLATWAAGGIAVPIDPTWPPARLAWVLDDAGVEVVLGGGALDDATLAGRPTMAVDLDAPSDPTSAPVDELAVIDPEATAYVLYTSGSTGRPKGVVVGHRSLAHYASWAADFYGRHARRPSVSMPLFSALTFDLTLTSIVVPLLTGGTIVVYPPTGERADLALVEVVRDDAVDLVKLTPSHLQLVEATDLDAPRRIAQLIFGGEALTRDVLRRARDRFGNEVVIHNEYGPTEATVGCVIHTVDVERDTGRRVPIGEPIPGTRAWVVDRHLQLVPEGVVGELVLGGPGLADGYLGRPELDAERFVDDPQRSGERLYRTGDLARVLRRPGEAPRLDCLGRLDEQVKVRGLRVELGEIEAVLTEHPAVDACAVRLETVERRDRPTAEPRSIDWHCRRCGLPSNHPNAALGADGVCRECHAFETYRDKVASYFRSEDELCAILDRAREHRRAAVGEAGYDCLALLSGGKDSTYVLCRLVDLGYRPLAFTLDNGFISEQAKANIRRVTDDLGVDHVFGSTPAMPAIFVDSLERFSNVCQGCFKTIYTLALSMARERGIPCVVTGLSRGQLFETRLTRELFTDLDFSAERIDHTVLEARKAYHRADDAVSRWLDVSAFRDDDFFDHVQVLDFFRFSDVSLDTMLETLDRRVPWIRPTDTGRSTNCLINDAGILVHQRERGFHNYALPYAWDVRMGHKTREAALDELDDAIDVEAVETMLDTIGYRPRDAEAGSRLVAYVVADASVTADGLAEHARATLPAPIVPTAFVHLDALPLTAHGKVDRSALQAPARDAIPASQPLEPRDPVEAALAELFAEVLGVDRVGIRDAFLDLGGDSIQAIQLAARGHRRGLRFTPEQLFEAPTVEALARLVERPSTVTDDEAARNLGVDARVVPLTPAASWSLDRRAVDEPSWLQALDLDVDPTLDPPLDASTIERALSMLPARHDALRMRCRVHDETPVGDLVDGSEPILRRLSVGTDDASLAAERDALAAAVRRRFTDGEACLFGALLVTDGTMLRRLVLVADHLVVDAVSWSILLGDLLDGAAAPAGSLRRWARAVQALGEASDARTIERWRDRLDAARGMLPEVVAPGTGGDEITVALSEERSRRLLDDVPATGRGTARRGLGELALAALVATLAEESGGDSGDRRVGCWVEGTGRARLGGERHHPHDAADPSAVVGWLTSLHPVAVEVPTDDADALLRRVAETLSSAPRDGVDYGAARWHGPIRVRNALAAWDGREVALNVLGRAEAWTAGGPFRPRRPLELLRDPSATPPFAITVDVLAIDDAVRCVWTLDTSRVDRDHARRLAERMRDHLERLIEHCLVTPAAVEADDFPLANLDEAKLAKLSAVLGRGRR